MPEPDSLKQLFLRRFRAFDEFTISLGDTAILVGPNNAGKSTVLAALRAAALMIRSARRIGTRIRIEMPEEYVWAYEFDTSSVGLEEDNLRWEFEPAETSFTLRLGSGADLRALWPPPDERGPYYVLRDPRRASLHEPAPVRVVFPSIGVLPPLAPIEKQESLLAPKYVGDSVGTRLASRHFRNHLWLLERGFWGVDRSLAEFLTFVGQWLPEMELQPAELRGGDLDVFYRDDLTHRWKEIVWAGDGFQVFIQLLFHVYRLQHSRVLVLDEPDIYLHADLQRRLVPALQSTGAQVVIATHSSEIAAEAGTAAVVWMDRSRRKAIRVRDDADLERLSASIGTGFDLRLARALRANVVLFVEGEDMRLLKPIARTLKADRFTTERQLAPVPIDGTSNWRRVEGFAWLVNTWLKRTVKGWLLLDRDYHSEEAVEMLRVTLHAAGLSVHVWRRKELENYLLVPGLLARATGSDEQWISEQLREISESMREDVLLRFTQAYREDFADRRGEQVPTSGAQFIEPLRAAWRSETEALARCPAKIVLTQLNDRLQRARLRTVSFERLAREITNGEIDDELAGFIRVVDRALA